MPSQSSVAAVAAIFNNVFGRTPTGQESSAWATQLDSGATATQLAAVLAASPEGAAEVSALYQQILGRGLNSVSSSEIAAGQAYLAQDRTNGLASLRGSIASSAEAQAAIRTVYQAVLGRVASVTEISNAETALANGATLAQLYTSAEASPELTANLTRAYQSDVHAAPSASVLAFLRQQIDSGATFANLTGALTGHAGSSTSVADTFNPAETLLAASGAGSTAPSTTATSTATGAATLVQLTNPATTSLTPTLHSS